MADLDKCVSLCEKLRSNKVLHKHMQWIFLVITVTGSLLKEMQLLPDWYFNNKRNVLNVYFVKLAWGWTLWLLLPFISISNFYISKKDPVFVLQRLSSLLVGTVVWYTCTHFFIFIEDLTGACYESESMDIIKMDYSSKLACKKSGLFWSGYDISGHSFLLAYSTLIILEETALMNDLKNISQRPPESVRAIVSVFYIALNVLVVIWIWMFFCTSVYFHDFTHKLCGTSFGILAWYVTYRIWYQKPFSPGLPTRQERKVMPNQRRYSQNSD
ncbi:fat storage-inducing transmembrane protein 2-like [Huso huso]|uniref:Fat storage-inducing transmembrane protein 2-like n=1 Tax=Huso huso TaxID=61971 RepID=A0ABR0YGY9_HUSHU